MKAALSGVLVLSLALSACAPGLGQDLIVLSTAGPDDGLEGPSLADIPCGRLAENAEAVGLPPPSSGSSVLDPSLCALFDIPVLEKGAPVRELGPAPGVRAVAATLELDGGVVAMEEGPSGGPALRFPSWVAEEPVPRAVVRLQPEAPLDGPDPMEPGTADFAFGASFRQEEHPDGVPPEDGDNLIQRGLFSETSQFKISVDAGRPSCRVAGTGGEVVVTAQEVVEAETWHRVACARRGDDVVLTLGRVLGDDVVLVEEVRATGPIGEVSWPGSTPVAIGGKLTKEGPIMESETDQFHGAVADPVIAILDAPAG